MRMSSTFKSQRKVDTAAARGLGVASLAIGLTEIVATRQLERLMGIDRDTANTAILRLMGVREILQGIDILSHDDPTPGVWARVWGDALDSALLGAAAMRTRRPGGLASVFAAVLPIVLLDVVFAKRLSNSRNGRNN